MQKKPPLSQRFTARLYQGVLVVLKCSDVRIIAIFGKCLGYLAWIFFPSRRLIVQRNLRIVINPKLRPHQLQALVRKNMVLTCMNFACALKVGLMRPEEMAQSIRLEGKEIFEEAGTNGRTGIACIPHAGNWEVLARIRPLFTKVDHFASMYRTMSNPEIEKMVYESRTHYGCEMYSKEKGLRGVLRLAKTGGLLGVLSDQFTHEGIYVPYFGKITGTTPLPSVLRKMCKGQLFSVFTRNRGLGKWDAVLGRRIDLTPNNVHQVAADTICVNQALERNQGENILDGFWMHHRWKCVRYFAPKQEESINQLAMQHMRLPFRILVALPPSFEVALHCIPALRCLKSSRPDAQLIVIAQGDEDQLAFWSNCVDCVDHVCSGKDYRTLRAELEEERIYQDGPFDILFMWNECKAILQAVRSQGTIYVSGWRENPLADLFQASLPQEQAAPPCPIYQDYLRSIKELHHIEPQDDMVYPYEPSHAQEEGGHFIAPFSSLGQADSWPISKWQDFLQKVKEPYQLLAFSQDEDQARAMAKELHIPCIICKPDQMMQFVNESSTLVSVDGSLVGIASLYGCRGVILYASQLPERAALWNDRMRRLNQHLPCHPCYEEKCCQVPSCIAQISVEDVLSNLSAGA